MMQMLFSPVRFPNSSPVIGKKDNSAPEMSNNKKEFNVSVVSEPAVGLGLSIDTKNSAVIGM